MDLNTMTSVTKLILVPMHKWKKIVGDRKNMNNVKTVDIPTLVQKGLGPKASDSLLYQRIRSSVQALSSPSFPHPIPWREGRGREEGRGRGEWREVHT